MRLFRLMDESGLIARQQRPELTLGTVEFVVPKEYWSREPVPMRWLFLIDVTEETVNTRISCRRFATAS